MYKSALNTAVTLQKQVYETPQNKSEKTENTQPSFSSNEGFRGYSVKVRSTLPAHFLCPITQDVMTEPVSVACGHTFEKSAIVNWVNTGKHDCPSCNRKINPNPDTWVPNWGIQSGIEEWKKKNEEPVLPFTLLSAQGSATLDVDKSDLLLKMAELHLKRDDFGKAVESYEEALQSTDSIETYVTYANLLERAHSCKAGKAFLYLGWVYCNEANEERAVEAYQKAVALQPVNRNFLEELAQCLERFNRREDAIHCYERLIVLSKTQGCSLSVPIKYYESMMRVNPNEPSHYRAFWTFLKEHGCKQRAREVKKQLQEVEGVSWEIENMALKKKVAKLKERLAEMEQAVAILQQRDLKHEAYLWLGSSNGSKLLNNDPTMKSLSLTDGSDDALKALALVLEKNQMLQVLHLVDRSAGIGDDGLKALALVLEKNQSLRSLDLGDSTYFIHQIGDEGLKALALALEKNQSLQCLSLSSSFSDEGLKALALALEKNQSLQRLTLSSSFSDEGLKALALALEKNQSLQRLTLSSSFSDEGLKALALALEKNQSLQYLTINNSINNSGFLFNQQVQPVPISASARAALEQAKAKSRILKELMIRP